jgi:hypothetical protein
VLRHLARRIDALSALLVLGVRTESLTPNHPTQALLGAMAGVPVVHLDLQPLTVDAVAAMAGDRDGAAVHRLTGGNPLFVTETLAAPDDLLPESVAAAVARVGQITAGPGSLPRCRPCRATPQSCAPTPRSCAPRTAIMRA